MKIVSNTSPLIFLEKLGALPLLTLCFTEIYLPQAVMQELGEFKPPDQIQLRKISALGAEFVAGALGRLHSGELEAMILAKEIQADYVCLDDLTARRKARRMGLQVIGTLGVLNLACQLGHLPAECYKRYLTDLTEKHGMYLSPPLLNKLMKQ